MCMPIINRYNFNPIAVNMCVYINFDTEKVSTKDKLRKSTPDKR